MSTSVRRERSYHRNAGVLTGASQSAQPVTAIDGMPRMCMLGAELDRMEDLTGSYFRVKNPNASSSCGCGTSFSV